MARIGYARVSTKSQCDDSQVDELTAYGCDKIFVDKGVSGKHASRPELDAALAYLRDGDVFVITRLSRAMRSLKHMIELAEELPSRGIGLVVIKQAIDTTTPQGRLVFHLLASIDEFQRELVVEGTREGLEAARARGRTGGRKAKLERQPGQARPRALRRRRAHRRPDRRPARRQPPDRLPRPRARSGERIARWHDEQPGSPLEVAGLFAVRTTVRHTRINSAGQRPPAAIKPARRTAVRSLGVLRSRRRRFSWLLRAADEGELVVSADFPDAGDGGLGLKAVAD